MVTLEDLTTEEQTSLYGAHAMLLATRDALRRAAEPTLFADERSEAYADIAERWVTAMTLLDMVALPLPSPPSLAVVLRYLAAVLDLEGDDHDTH